jgi:hypothetical protein
MSKSNFEVLAKQPIFARPSDAVGADQAEDRAAGASLFAKPPRPDDDVAATVGFGAVRVFDGRSARRTGRTVQFATVVSQQFREWLKGTAKANGKSQAALLDDMRAAYIEKHGE